jgi:hypothetical protein
MGTLKTSSCGEWTKFSKLWLPLLAQELQTNAEAIIKKWKRNIKLFTI